MVKKPKKQSKAKRMSRSKKEADRVWSLAVRERDGNQCQVRGCDATSRVFAHHIFSRRHLATRWDLDNGFTICWGHHKKGHTDHEWLRDEIIAKIGEDKFRHLKYRSGLITVDLLEEDLMRIIEGLKGG